MFKEGQIIKTSKPSSWHLEDSKGVKQYSVGTLWRVISEDGKFSVDVKNLLTNEVARGCPPGYFKEL